MKNIKLISFLLFILMYTCSISFADTYNGVPLYNIDYSEFVRPIPRNMPHGNYYNDWNFNSRSDVQNNSSNYDYQNRNTFDSGSTHFIHSSSPNPSYCIPDSSYSICH